MKHISVVVSISCVVHKQLFSGCMSAYGHLVMFLLLLPLLVAVFTPIVLVVLCVLLVSQLTHWSRPQSDAADNSTENTATAQDTSIDTHADNSKHGTHVTDIEAPDTGRTAEATTTVVSPTDVVVSAIS